MKHRTLMQDLRNKRGKNKEKSKLYNIYYESQRAYVCVFMFMLYSFFFNIQESLCLVGLTVSVCDCRSRCIRFKTVIVVFLQEILSKQRNLVLFYARASESTVMMNINGNRYREVSALKYSDNQFNVRIQSTLRLKITATFNIQVIDCLGVAVVAHARC